MPRESYLFIDQQIWVLEGQLRFAEGDQTHDLEVGDCLQLGEPQVCTFENPTALAVSLPGGIAQALIPQTCP